MNQHDSWEACPEGAIQQVADQQRRELASRQQSGAWPKIALATIAVVLLAVVGYVYSTQGGLALTCAETVVLFDDYHAGNLSAAMQEKVIQHLDGCPHCRQKYESRFGAISQALKLDGARQSAGAFSSDLHWSHLQLAATVGGLAE